MASILQEVWQTHKNRTSNYLLKGLVKGTFVTASIDGIKGIVSQFVKIWTQAFLDEFDDEYKMNMNSLTI